MLYKRTDSEIVDLILKLNREDREILDGAVTGHRLCSIECKELLLNMN